MDCGNAAAREHVGKIASLRVSVVIPVYNKEHHLSDCIACLDEQTIDKSAIEALFVNDGSTDGSDALCQRFAKERPWVRVISQPNGGVCSARNAGISGARGQYLFFLDPDDTLSPETLSNVVDFFDACSDEVDIVTYPIVSIRNGRRQRPHHRYEVLRQAGVYDLTLPENATIAQTTMNVAVRNRFESNILFDFAPANGVIVHEDEKYCTDVLQRTMKLGFCPKAEYRWMRTDEGASTALRRSESLYENNLALFEDLFSRCQGNVPPYIQGLLVNDIAWKLKAGVMLPAYLKGEEYDESLARMGRLLEHVSDEMILNHPNLSNAHRLFVLRLKDSESLQWLVAPTALAVMRGSSLVFAAAEVVAELTRVTTRGGALEVSGRLDSPFFAGWKGGIELLLHCRSHQCNGASDVRLLRLEEVVGGCETAAMKLYLSYKFNFTCDLADGADVWLDLRIGGAGIPLRWAMSDLRGAPWASQNVRIAHGRLIRFATEGARIQIDRLTEKMRIILNRLARKARNTLCR